MPLTLFATRHVHYKIIANQKNIGPLEQFRKKTNQTNEEHRISYYKRTPRKQNRTRSKTGKNKLPKKTQYLLYQKFIFIYIYIYIYIYKHIYKQIYIYIYIYIYLLFFYLKKKLKSLSDHSCNFYLFHRTY